MKQPPSSIPPDDFRDPTIRFTEGILDFNFRVRPSLKDMLSDVHHVDTYFHLSSRTFYVIRLMSLSSHVCTSAVLPGRWGIYPARRLALALIHWSLDIVHVTAVFLTDGTLLPEWLPTLEERQVSCLRFQRLIDRWRGCIVLFEFVLNTIPQMTNTRELSKKNG